MGLSVVVSDILVFYSSFALRICLGVAISAYTHFLM